MTIQITCKCGYSSQADDWSSAADSACPQCGGLLQKAVMQDEPDVEILDTVSQPSEAPARRRQTKSCPFCGGEILRAAIKCKHCGEMLGAPGFASSEMDPATVLAEYQELLRKRKTYNRLSFAFAIPGFLAALSPGFLDSALGETRPIPPRGSAMFLLELAMLAMPLLGIVLLAIGFGFYAKYKGRSPAWGLCGLMSCLGILILAVLKDYNARKLLELKSTLLTLGQRV